MFVNRITTANNSALNFTRRLTASEEQDYKTNAIKPALDYLGTEELAMIIHGTCFPETKKDLGVGSPYGAAAAKFIPFEMLHGFNSNQLGPVGVISDAQNISPYKSTVFTKNYLFTDLKALTTDRYANILSNTTIDAVFNTLKNSEENYSYSNFPDAFANYKHCIKIANKNFKVKLKENNPQAIALNEEFEQFKSKKWNVLYKEALFDVLSKMYATDDYSKWDETDQNLSAGLDRHDPEAVERAGKIIKRSNGDFSDYIFGQFIIDKQIKENSKYRKENGFKYISDLLVGFSKSDAWANQNLFLKDYEMGCPYGGKNGPQLWKIPVLDPKKLFNSDGSLGPAGIYLKHKLEAVLEDFDNVRIDHALGLVDPYIYDKNSVFLYDGNVDLKRFKANNISAMPHIDPYKNYQKVLNKIILPTLEKHGIDKNSPVWEDLCTDTSVYNKIYHEENHLPGITQLEWKRGQNENTQNNWGLIGSHDSDPAIKMIKKSWVKTNDAWNIFYLAGFLNSNPKRAQYRDEFCKKIDQDDNARVKAKFAELFLTCKKIQISFADFFGIDKTYNVGGIENDTNWKLRLNKNYEDTYYKNLSSDNPTALNMPEVLKMAVQAKTDIEKVQQAHALGISDEHIQAENDENVQRIIDKLDKYEKILKEPE